MKNIFLIFLLVLSFNGLASENAEIINESITIHQGKVLIDLSKLDIQDIMLKDGTLLDSAEVQKILERGSRKLGSESRHIDPGTGTTSGGGKFGSDHARHIDSGGASGGSGGGG